MSDSEYMAKLRAVVRQFRNAIERCEPTRLGPAFDRFPHGCCGQVTPLLGTYLQEKEFGIFDYVQGQRLRRDPRGGVQSHAWLERDGVIVDITADQFPEICEPVIVTTNSSWHAQFAGTTTHIADYRIYPPSFAAALLHRAYAELRTMLPRA